ncbi:MAG: hypothetical protein ABSF35_23530 [Polyangia bacterium]
MPARLVHDPAMAALFLFILGALRAALRSRTDLLLENLAYARKSNLPNIIEVFVGGVHMCAFGLL